MVSRAATRRGERPEVAVAVLDDLARRQDARPGMLGGDFDAEITLVVLEANVVARLVLLDQIVFEDQRFLVVARDQSFDIGDPPHQKLDLRALVGMIEVGAHPRPQILGLADVDDLAASFAHQINAGSGRQAGEFFGQHVHGMIRGLYRKFPYSHRFERNKRVRIERHLRTIGQARVQGAKSPTLTNRYLALPRARQGIVGITFESRPR